MITGVIFFFTAATYIEATTMFPEAGGSSSFARHAFNEFWSFFAAWGQMLNYIITASISAYFVPHYLGIFWEPLKEAPWDILFGIGVIIVLGALNIVGVQESAKVNILLSVVDFATQVLLVILGLENGPRRTVALQIGAADDRHRDLDAVGGGDGGLLADDL